MTGAIGSTRWTRVAALGPVLLLAVLLGAYHLAFGRFFPNEKGALGHDHSLALTSLLAGYYWLLASGPLAVPWFTPAFCGGQPFYADVQSTYYSVPQLLTLAWDPMTASYLTMLLFAAVGYAGAYRLHRALGAGRPASAAGATVFMFNGFFAHRMIVGHLVFHGFMLVPWIARWLLGAGRDRAPRGASLDVALHGCLAGLAAAYALHSGLGSLLVPVGLAVAMLLLLDLAETGGADPGRIAARCAVAGVIAGAVSASKLAVGHAFMSAFPRDHYLLPGYRTFLDSLRIALASVFVSPSDIEERSRAALTNVQWIVGRHELEYGVTLVPLLVLAIGGVAAVASRGRERPARAPRGWRRVVPLVLLALLAMIPLALNTYGADWNALLKRTPVLRSSSSLVRWFLVYVPLAAALTSLALERVGARWRAPLGAAAIAAVVLLNLAADRDDYAAQDYRPDAVIGAHRAAASSGAVPPIEAVGAAAPGGREVQRNDLLALGRSQMLCYNPSFGYRLERLPLGGLHPGSVWDAGADGRLNVKNPACYLFPRENGCRPGDHFLASERESAERFVRYEPFAFEVSGVQRAANAVTLAALAASLLLLVAAAALRVRARGRPDGGPGPRAPP